jgi:predicted dienelactone hydrolase
MSKTIIVFCMGLFALSGIALGQVVYNPDANKVDITSLETTWHDDARNRDVPVKIYYPTAGKDRLPIIIFSHGLGGSREGYSYVGKYWASHGYVSVHLTHVGSDTAAILANGFTAMEKTELAIVSDPINAVDRCGDVSFAIDQLTDADTDDKSPLKDRLDLKHIGMAGHSFGGNTTMLIAGEQTISGNSFADKRISCAIAMSPPIAVPKPRWNQVYADVKIPLFVMTGTLDDSPIGETKAADRRVPFDHVKNIPAYLLTLTGGDHMVFSGQRRGGFKSTDDHFHQLIQQGSVAFWDAYLRGNDSAKKWLKEDFAKLVDKDGVFELK